MNALFKMQHLLKFIYFFFTMPDLHCCAGFAPVGSEPGLLSSCAGFSVWWLSCCERRLQGTCASVAVVPGLRSTGSVVVQHRLSCFVVCGIFLDQGLNLCPLHWQADSYPVHQQGGPQHLFFFFFFLWWQTTLF